MRTTLRRALIPGLFLGWSALVFLFFFPEVGGSQISRTLGSLLDPVWFVTTYLGRSPWPAVLASVLFFLTACALGLRILDWFRPTAADGNERLLLAPAFGFLLLSYLTFALSLLGLLSQGLFWGIVVAVLSVSMPRLLCEMRAARASFRDAALTRFEKLLLLYSGIQLGINALAAAAPPTAHDALTYRLAVPKAWDAAHGLVALPDILESVFARNVAMVYLFAIELGGEIAAQFGGYLIGVLLCLWILWLGARYSNRLVGLGAVAILLTVPVVRFEMRSADVDFVIALYVLVGFHFARTWISTRRFEDLVMAALLVGFASGTRYSTLLHILLISAVLATATKRLRPSLAFAAVAALGSAHWIALDFWQTGDPFFPYLSGDPLIPGFRLFDDTYWKNFNPNRAGSDWDSAGLRLDVTRAPWSLWGMHFEGANFDGNLGPLLILLSPAFVLGGSVLRAYSLLFLAFWLAFGHSNRYLVAILPMVALTIASGVALLGPARRVIVTAAVAFGLLMLPFFHGWGPEPPVSQPPGWTQIPWRFLSGLEIRYDYLRRVFWTYPAIHYLNSFRPQGKVLFVGAHDGPPLYYMDFSPIHRGLASYKEILAANTIAGAVAALREREVEYLLVEKLAGRRYFITRVDSPFRAYLDPVLEMNGAAVYRVLKVPRATSPLIDLVTRLESEPNLTVPLLGHEYRIAIRTAPERGVEYPIRVGSSTRLRFALNLTDQNWRGLARGHVEVVDAQTRVHRVHTARLDRTIPDRPLLWQNGEVDLSSFSGQDVILRLSAEQTELVWAEPRIVQR